MSKVAVVYWSDTGNTEIMANKVVEGVEDSGNEALVFKVGDFNEGMVGDYDAIAFGCPAMGSEELEADEFEPVFEACIPNLNGKKVGLFGSYDWGDGEWMTEWESNCKDNGMEVVGSGVIANLEPDDDALENCFNLGKAL